VSFYVAWSVLFKNSYICIWIYMNLQANYQNTDCSPEDQWVNFPTYTFHFVASQVRDRPPCIFPLPFPVLKGRAKTFSNVGYTSLPPLPPSPCDSPSAPGRPGCVCDPTSTRDCSGTCRRCAYLQFPTRPHLALVEIRTAPAPSFLSISSCLLFPF